MITDAHPSSIWIDGTVAATFLSRYNAWRRSGCSFYFRLIDIRRLPSTVKTSQLRQNEP